jgi:hypothetical protein
MISKAKARLGESVIITDDWEEVLKEISGYKTPSLILSSVIHEVYSYSNSKVIKQFWLNKVFGGQFKFICIRDMIPFHRYG